MRVRRSPLSRLTVVIRSAFFVAAIAGSTGHLASAPGAEREIRAVLDTQAAAWNRGDVDGYMNGYARHDTTEFVSGDTLTRGWQTVRDRYRKKYDTRASMGTLTFSDVQISPLGIDAAFVVGRWKLVRKNDRPHGLFTLLFRRTADGWRIVHDHTSSATP